MLQSDCSSFCSQESFQMLPKDGDFLEASHHHQNGANCSSLDSWSEKIKEQLHSHGIQCKGGKRPLVKASCQTLKSFSFPGAPFPHQKQWLSHRHSEGIIFSCPQLLLNAEVIPQQLRNKLTSSSWGSSLYQLFHNLAPNCYIWRLESRMSLFRCIAILHTHLGYVVLIWPTDILPAAY